MFNNYRNCLEIEQFNIAETRPKDVHRMTNSVDSDPTSPLGAVGS